jgi:hypothetical protein
MSNRLVCEEIGCGICGDPVTLPWDTAEPNFCDQCKLHLDKRTEEEFEAYVKRRGIVFPDLKFDD